MRASLVALVCVASSGACLMPEDEVSTSATFNLWCMVVDATDHPVDGAWVNLAASKYDYSGEQEPDTVITNGEATSSYDPNHPGTASFVVGYTLHSKGEDQEYATFTCSTLDHGALISETDSRSYAEVEQQGTVVDVGLLLELPP